MNDVEKSKVVGKYLEVMEYEAIVIREDVGTYDIQQRLLDHGVTWVQGEDTIMTYNNVESYKVRQTIRGGLPCLVMTYYIAGEYEPTDSLVELTIDEFDRLLRDDYVVKVLSDYDYAMGLI